MVTAPAFDGTTPRSPWSAWARSATLMGAPELSHDPSALLVVAAHPDDEVLGAYGLMVRARRSGAPVTVVIATNGEASHPGSPSLNCEQIAEVRRRESTTSLEGVATDVIRLGLPDGDLRRHRHHLLAALDPLVQGLPAGALAVAPWVLDGHPDHEMVGDVTAALAREHAVECMWAPIWALFWGTPDVLHDAQLRRVPLDAAARASKAAAIAVHASQTAPLSSHPADRAVLTPEMLERFADDEYFLLAPAAQATKFDDRYRTEQDPWATRSSWYEHRKRQVVLSALPRERYRLAVEMGCGTAMLAADLAPRCNGVLAVDQSLPALREARRTLSGLPTAWVEQRSAEDGIPLGDVDLVVISELGSYLEEAALTSLLEQARDGGAHIALCHWRPQSSDMRRGGFAVHRLAAALPGLRSVVSHIDEQFVVDVLIPE